MTAPQAQTDVAAASSLHSTQRQAPTGWRWSTARTTAVARDFKVSRATVMTVLDNVRPVMTFEHFPERCVLLT